MSSCINQRLSQLRDNGLCHIAKVFNDDQVSEINRRIDEYCTTGHEGIVYERDGEVIRAIHGPHLFDGFFTDIARHPLLLDLVKQYLGEDVYIHQYKVNMKLGMDGKAWPWHQDYVFWQENDHIAEANLVNIALALNETTMLNGPLCFIPGSHLQGNLCLPTCSQDSSWRDDVSDRLSFQVEKSVVSELLQNNSPTFATAQAGDVYCFDPQLVHCSGNNMSPDDRRLLIITYNVVSNVPTMPSARPAFLCATETSPL